MNPKQFDIEKMTLAWKIQQLNEPPDLDLIHPPNQWVEVPYLTGEVDIYYLNEIFGPDGWGYELEQWPELKPLGDGQGVYLCRGTVWFRFGEGNIVRRPMPGMCAVRPKTGRALEDMGFAVFHMTYQGCITDMIKNAASTLGVRFGLGLNDDQLRAKLRLGMPPRKSPSEDAGDLGFDQTAAQLDNGSAVAFVESMAWDQVPRSATGYWKLFGIVEARRLIGRETAQEIQKKHGVDWIGAIDELRQLALKKATSAEAAETLEGGG